MKQSKKIIILVLIIFAYLLILVPTYYYLNFKSAKISKEAQIKNIHYPAKVIKKSFVRINDTVFDIELADTFDKQTKGLSNHEQLTDTQAMLFKFPYKQIQNFWMKEMNFSLDIIWINNLKIIKIDKNLPPEGLTPKKTYSSIVPVNYVLEINGGLSDKYGFKIGDDVEIRLLQ